MTLRRFFPLGGGGASGAWPALLNPSFEGGLTDWTDVDTGGSAPWYIRNDRSTSGAQVAYWVGGSGSGHAGGIESVLTNGSSGTVVAGQFVTAQCDIALDTPDESQNRAEVRIYWYDNAASLVSYSQGNLIRGDSKGAWRHSSVSAPAPAGAVTAKFAVWVAANGRGGVAVDSCAWVSR